MVEPHSGDRSAGWTNGRTGCVEGGAIVPSLLTTSLRRMNEHISHPLGFRLDQKSSSAACTAARREELDPATGRAQIARQRVEIFKPIDDRYAGDHRLAQRPAHSPGPKTAKRDPALGAHEAQVIGNRRSQFSGWHCSMGGAPAAGQAASSWSASTRTFRDTAVRSHAAVAGHRRVHHQDARHLYGAASLANRTYRKVAGRAAAWCRRR